MSVFAYQKDVDGIVTITMDMTGPVNAMNDEFGAAMAATMDQLESEDGLRGVILASAKKTFFAGGDLKMLLAVESGQEGEFFASVEESKALLRRLEKLPVPVVAAINGAALGGGFELALACNHRIVWDNRTVEIGLPEVTLGLLPGGGGVVRMVHLLGFQAALPYVLEGKKVAGAQAVEAGLVHEAVSNQGELVPRSKEWILNSGEDVAIQPWDRKGHKIPGGDIWNPKVGQEVMVAPHMLKANTRGLMPAPEKILETAVSALATGFDAALTQESRNLAYLVTTPHAKNMITTFFFQLNQVNGGASRPAGFGPSTIGKLGVIGSGMMGQGIAYVAAKAGIETVLKDVSLEAAEKGKAYSAKLLDKAISRGRSTEDKKQQLLDLITPTDSDDDLEGCDLIIEAVFENPDLKARIVKAAEDRLSEGGIWGSNTSTLPITGLASAAANPQNFIGIHFFSPVDKMPLVELICGKETSDETLAKAFDFVRQIRKTPIVVNDSLGFFTSRTFGAQPTEAAQMVAEGIDPLRIDNLGKHIGMPVGPLTVNDEVSLKLGVEIKESQLATGLIKPEDETRPEAWALQKALVHDHNRGGRYHGDGGYYDYADRKKTIWPGLNALYFRPDVDEAISDADIKDRLLFAGVIEALKCLEENVVTTVADANIGSIMGIGAPPWTGGYVQYVNTYGIEAFVYRCDELANKYGERFRAPAIVRKRSAEGATIT